MPPHLRRRPPRQLTVPVGAQRPRPAVPHRTRSPSMMTPTVAWPAPASWPVRPRRRPPGHRPAAGARWPGPAAPPPRRPAPPEPARSQRRAGQRRAAAGRGGRAPAGHPGPRAAPPPPRSRPRVGPGGRGQGRIAQGRVLPPAAAALGAQVVVGQARADHAQPGRGVVGPRRGVPQQPEEGFLGDVLRRGPLPEQVGEVPHQARVVGQEGRAPLLAAPRRQPCRPLRAPLVGPAALTPS